MIVVHITRCSPLPPDFSLGLTAPHHLQEFSQTGLADAYWDSDKLGLRVLNGNVLA
jgi:hypothetical protein